MEFDTWSEAIAYLLVNLGAEIMIRTPDFDGELLSVKIDVEAREIIVEVQWEDEIATRISRIDDPSKPVPLGWSFEALTGAAS